MNQTASNPGEAAQPVGATDLLHRILADLETGQNAPTAPQASDRGGNAGEDGDGPKAMLGDIIEQLDERAFGFMLLLLALPCCLPFVYLLPQIVALPMLALAGQLALGRASPWLPAKLKSRRFSIADFHTVIKRAQKYGGWIEKIARPRLLSLTSHTGSRIVGALLLVPTASILVPLPATNTIPGIGVAIASLGLIERDGLLVITGVLIGFIWVALLLFLGLEAATIIKEWLAARV